MISFAPTTIDLSRMRAPEAIETLSADALLASFMTRFQPEWDAARLVDPTLPPFTTASVQGTLVRIVGRAVSYLRFLDRGRVNDAIRAVLATLATGGNLDNVVARQNVERLVVVTEDPATQTPAVMETDAQLLRRYLLSFDRPSAGSAGRYLYEAYTAFPLAGDVRVNGRAIHGRRGDTDVVVSGPGGRDATDAEMAAVRDAVLDPSGVPEAVSVSVLRATRLPYSVSLLGEVPPGPDKSLLAAEMVERVRSAAADRTVIGGEVPDGYLRGAGYGSNIIKVVDRAAVAIAPNPYVVPVCEGIAINTAVRG